jgi:ribosomal protein S18 acetylase RimI-like enzyme
MIIRKAEINDSKQIAECLLLAMDDIVYEFIGIRDHEKAKAFMLHFALQKNNQYSFENCWVATENNKVVAAINLYNGADLSKLRTPVLAYIETQFCRLIMPENETQAGEMYIDTFGVLPEQRGKGVGTCLLQFMINEYVEKCNLTLGLLVEEDKALAKKLYMKLGFKAVGKKTLMGKKMAHLQRPPI